MVFRSARVKIVSIVYIIFACVLFGGSAQATTYSAVNDFSLAGNPNGSWSYFYGSTFLPTPTVGSGVFAGLDFWFDSLPEPHSVIIGKNVTAAPLHYESIVQPVDQLEMDPEADTAVVRFIASKAGNYSIIGDFLGIDVSEHSHPVQVLKNGVVVFNATIGGYGQVDPFKILQPLKAGDVIDFDVLTGQDFHNLSTGLAATIATANPEPASIWIAGLGLTGLSVMGRRRRRTAPHR